MFVNSSFILSIFMYEAFLIWQRSKTRQLPSNFSIKAQLHSIPQQDATNNFQQPQSELGMCVYCYYLLWLKWAIITAEHND